MTKKNFKCKELILFCGDYNLVCGPPENLLRKKAIVDD